MSYLVRNLPMELSNKNIARHLKQYLEGSIPMKLIKQPSTNTCWAACYKMVDNFYQRKNKWCIYINFQTGHCNQCVRPSNGCNKPRKTTEILDDWQKKLGYTKTAHTQKSISINEIRKHIKEKNQFKLLFVIRVLRSGIIF